MSATTTEKERLVKVKEENNEPIIAKSTAGGSATDENNDLVTTTSKKLGQYHETRIIDALPTQLRRKEAQNTKERQVYDRITNPVHYQQTERKPEFVSNNSIPRYLPAGLPPYPYGIPHGFVGYQPPETEGTVVTFNLIAFSFCIFK